MSLIVNILRLGGNMEEIKKIEPNKDIVEMTKTILAQNEKILEMNIFLIERFSSPLIYMPLSGSEE